MIALATAYQETKFVNYQHPTDATTSIGLFAQMTIYYGADVAADPAKPPARSSTGWSSNPTGRPGR